jgi:hypothetical protein
MSSLWPLNCPAILAIAMEISTQLLFHDFVSHRRPNLWDGRMVWRHVVSGGVRIFVISLCKDCNA